MKKQRPLQNIGFWKESGGPLEWPDPRDLVDNNPIEEKLRVVAYLRAGISIAEWLGYSHCRFEGGPPDGEMGHRDMSDGYWLWPEGLWIYIARFNVKLPERFLTHMKANDYRIPEGLNPDEVTTIQSSPKPNHDGVTTESCG